MENDKTFITPIAKCTIVTSRIMPFSKLLVYDAWAKPEHLKNWWGPNGFTNTFHEFDLQPGGMWRFIMHGPDGKDYDNESEFVEIIPGERIVFNHISPPQFQVNATFEEIADNKTKLTFRMIFNETKVYEALKDFCAEKNEENFDRLEEELKRMEL